MNVYIFDGIFTSKTDKKRRNEKIRDWCNDNGAYINTVSIKSKELSSKILELKAIIERINNNSNIVSLIESIPDLNSDNIIDFNKLLEELISRGVRVAFVSSERIFKDNNKSLIIDELNKILNKNDKKMIMSKLRSDVFERERDIIRNNGISFSINTPRWIDADKINNCYVLNYKKETIRKVFELYLDIKSFLGVANALNAEEVPVLSKAKAWGATSVKSILMNKAVKGTLVLKDEEFENYFPRIISDEVFEKTSSLINSSSIKKRSKQESFIISDMSFCGCCGSKMVTTRAGNKDASTYRYLSCTSKKCSLKPFNYSFVEPLIISLLSLIDKKNENRLILDSNEMKKESRRKIDELQSLIDKKSNSLSILYDLYSESQEAILKSKISGLVKEIDEYKAEVSRTKNAMVSGVNLYSIDEILLKIKRASKKLDCNSKIAELRDNLSNAKSRFVFEEDRTIHGSIAGNEFIISGVNGIVIIEACGKRMTLNIESKK